MQDGLSWSWNGGVAAWKTTLKHQNGTIEELHDSERPRVWVSPSTGQPELIFAASGGQRQPTEVGKNEIGYNVVQKIATQ